MNGFRSFVFLIGLSAASGTAAAGAASSCQVAIDSFNAAIDAGSEYDAQSEIDKMAGSAECGVYQTAAQRRLAALRLSAVHILMARGRPVADYDRLLIAAAKPEVLWQASATLGEVRFGERRFVDATQAYDRAIEIVKNETLTPTAPEKFEIEGLISRSAQARILAANVKDDSGASHFVQSAHDQRDGTFGGVYSRSVRGISLQAIPLPITFEFAKTSFTSIGKQAADELASVLKEQRPDRIKLVGHTDVRGSADNNLRLSEARAQALAAFLKEAGVNVTVETAGVGATEPVQIPDTAGLSQEDIYALNRRVEFIRR